MLVEEVYTKIEALIALSGFSYIDTLRPFSLSQAIFSPMPRTCLSFLTGFYIRFLGLPLCLVQLASQAAPRLIHASSVAYAYGHTISSVAVFFLQQTSVVVCV